MAYILDLPRSLPEHQARVGIGLRLIRFIVCAVHSRIHAWMVWRTVQNLQRLDDRTLKDYAHPIRRPGRATVRDVDGVLRLRDCRQLFSARELRA